MKKSELRQIIKEEIKKVLKEESIKLNKDEQQLVNMINQWADKSDKNIQIMQKALFGKGSQTTMKYTLSNLPKDIQTYFNYSGINKKNVIIKLTQQYGESGQDF